MMVVTWLVPLAILAAATGSDDGKNAVGQMYASAVSTLQSRMGDPALDGPLPRKSDPRNTPIFAQITFSMDQLGSPAFPVDGPRSFENICAPLNAIGMRYMLNGTRSILPPGPRTPEASRQLAAKTLANFLEFQDEISITNSAGLICFARHLPNLEAFLDSIPPEQRTDIRLKGARGGRDHAGNMLFDELMATANPQLKLANRRLAAHSVDVSAEVIVQRITITQRQALRARMAPIALFPPEFRPLYLRVRAMLENQRCVGLCLLG